ncbi:low molecular weight protein-tyrosine-phosphatase [Flavobacterium tibetense]|uniref:protein-tyrosine-phosphatase n=1 Tax=Flavobacterium tibetense TaxID=2233533 RepID=A0A365P499_9FLAO|nr:low molecular weight protein-tyrosine-phosphatase [Flavobacterium tibetense]RBA29239.1 low molecular weight phosphotyrosine protein phosphatase [Flavobacterium tibetense]
MATKILMVCLGNICRSPLAEGILQSKLPKDKFHVDSAGTGGWHADELPDSRSMKIASKYGIDISNQRARQFQVQDFHTFDYIYVMDQSNYQNVLQLAPNEIVKSKVKLILDEITPNKKAEVPDPYFGGEDGFEHVFQLLDEVCEQIAKRLIK